MESSKKSFYTRARSMLEKIFLHLDRFFNFLFSSDYNPLYRSGTIAAFLLFIVIVTGIYLVFFYKLNAPYDSVVQIQSQVFTGRWIRSLHRHASDAAVFSVIVHFFRMLLQGKTWGPRTLAWMSGIFLTLLLFVSGWTGYVMIWDAHGQALAIGGAKIFDSMKIFGDPISRAFNGETMTPSSSFFFMNLFLHIVIPLLMIFGLWLHTAKMARAVWFPNKKMMLGIVSVSVLSAVLIPAPLLNKGNLLVTPNKIKIDWFFDFWLKWSHESPGEVFLSLAFLFLFIILIPLWLKPKQPEKLGVASNDPHKCQGCGQCVKDCPYEAIQMIPRTVGKGSPTIAFANPDLCVGCGICSASCDPFTMGPEDRRAGDLFKAAKLFATQPQLSTSPPSSKTLVVACKNQQGSLNKISKMFADDDNIQVFPVECSGTVHAAVLEYFGKNYKDVLVTACPERNCTNKDGFQLLRERISGKRLPTFTPKFDRTKISLLSVGDGEETKILKKLKKVPTGRDLKFLPIVSGVILFMMISFVSQIPALFSDSSGILRLSWRLTGQNIKICEDRTQAQLSNLPAHMRTQQICTQKPIDYQLLVSINGENKITEIIKAGGLHGDRPIYVHQDIKLPSGNHQVQIHFEPLDDSLSDGLKLEYESEIKINNNEIVLIHLPQSQKKLVIKKGDINEN